MNHYSRPHARVAAALLLALVGFPCICFSQTGDSVIDGYFSYEDWQIKVGSTAAPENLAPTSYAGIINRCNSSFAPSWESNCPSDLLYTPNHWTGGYQAFGVALNRRDESTDLVYDCYTWWYQDEVGNWVMDYSCEFRWIYTPGLTRGIVAARIKFGADLSGGGLWGPKPMSTMAFKGNTVYLPEISAANCTAIWIGPSAPCVAQSDVVAVKNAGYEDKLVIRDFNCGVISRGGNDNQTDFNAGCFTGSGYLLSDLPAVYLDTTIFDGPDYFVPGVGSAAPTAIVEGQTYSWATYFGEYGAEARVPHTVSHRSAVTAYEGAAPGCSSSALYNCYFNVDQAAIAPAITFN
jgi:hypothetical protein